jgi:hypothetical protein
MWYLKRFQELLRIIEVMKDEDMHLKTIHVTYKLNFDQSCRIESQ